MSRFNLHPLTIALLGSITTTVFAAEKTATTENSTAHQLSTIVVSASGFEQSLKDAPASISVITQEDIERKNATSIADLLVDIPGVDVRNGVGKTSGLNVSIRGMSASDTLILIDGRRQTTSTDVTPNGFGEAATGFIPPLSAIERIEVIRGPMSTLYGSDAMGGVINIITKKVSDQWSGNVTVSGNAMEHSSEADSWKTSFLLNGPLIHDQLGLQLRGSYYDRGRSDRIEGSTGRDPRPTTAHNYDIGGKLTYKLNDQNALWLDSFHSSQNYKNEDNRLGTLDTAAKASGYKDKLEFNRNQYAIGHDGDYDFGTWRTYISQTETETKGRTIPNRTFPNNAYAGDDRTLKNTDLVADTHLIMPIQDHKLTLGTEYKKAKIRDDIAGIDAEFSKHSYSFYAEDEWNIINNVLFTFGGRYEEHSGFGGHFSPRAYLVWNASNELTLKGGVSTGYKAPSAKALYDGIISVGNQGASFGIGSPDLKPEESTNYEIGFNYNNGNLDLTTTAFLNKIKNLITTGPALLNCAYEAAPNRPGCVNYGSQITVQDTFSQSINAKRAETRGVEVSAKYSIIPEWDIKAAYTYMKTKITEGPEQGEHFTNVPRNAFNLTSTWHIQDALDVWLQYEYKSDRTRFSTIPTAPSTGLGSSDYEEYKLLGDKLAGYSLFNLGASYIVTDQLRLNMAVNNLLDKDFTEGQNYLYNGGEATAYKYLDIGSSISGTYITGRNYWLSVSYDF